MMPGTLPTTARKQGVSVRALFAQRHRFPDSVFCSGRSVSEADCFLQTWYVNDLTSASKELSEALWGLTPFW